MEPIVAINEQNRAVWCWRVSLACHILISCHQKNPGCAEADPGEVNAPKWGYRLRRDSIIWAVAPAVKSQLRIPTHAVHPGVIE